ncbi:MAG: hypothetical protein KJ077_38540 [Anaerolineae bacterium]|nr:hypothetical protein [Anaerolineae bacterium]
MDIDVKLRLFRTLVQNKSLADLKKQVGDEGIEALQHIAEACNQQDARTLLQSLDKFLMLASVGPKAFQIEHATLKPEVFNDIRDILTPLLKEIVPAPPPNEERQKLKLSWVKLFKRGQQAK